MVDFVSTFKRITVVGGPTIPDKAYIGDFRSIQSADKGYW